MNAKHDQPGSWVYRRRFMFIVSLFCAMVICYCLYKELDTEVAQTAVTMAFTTLISITGAYVFGACWDYKNSKG